MSIIALTDLGESFANVPNIIEAYQDDLASIPANLNLKGKTLKQANLEHPTWYAFYDERRVELSIFSSLLETEVERTRGRLLKKYTENYSRELPERAKERYIDSEQAYIDVFKVYLIFKELQDKYAATVEAFKARGFALKNLVELAVNDLNERII